MEALDDFGKTIQETFKGPWAPPYHDVMGTFIGWIIAGVLLLALIITVIVQGFDYYTPANLVTHSNAFIKTWEPVYGAASAGRKSLAELLVKLQKDQQIQPAQKCLSNFYIMTANAGGMFLPGEGGNLSICSNEALSYTLRAGCRGFVFDVIERLQEKGKPVIMTVDADPSKKWRQLSMNYVPFRDPINRLRAEAFGEGSMGQTQVVQLKNTADPIFIYLRFLKRHTPAFYNAVADAIDNAFKDYKLDYTWASGRRGSDFYTTNIEEFMGRIIIVSNQMPSGTRLQEMINIVSPSSLPSFYTSADVSNITADQIPKSQGIIQQNICLAMNPSETPDGQQNKLDWRRAHSLGIQMVAMNFFNKNVQDYRNFFGEYSFAMKPQALRYSVKVGSSPNRPGPEADMKGGKIDSPSMVLRT